MAEEPAALHPSRVAIVTGASSGIGRATAWELCRMGYTVVLACRCLQAAQDEKQRIIEATGGSPVVVGPLDLASTDSIREFASAFHRAHPRLDVLVNNAGCNFITEWRTDKGVPGMVQKDGSNVSQRSMQVNYLGPFHLTRLLEGKLQECRARVVNVSSVMHRVSRISSTHEFLTSSTAGTYGNTKLANVIFSQALYQKSNGRIQATSVDPGGVATGIYRGTPIVARVVQAACRMGIMATPAEGCKAVVSAATCSWPGAPGSVPVSPATRQSKAATALQAPFFARGLFASPVISLGGSNSVVARMVRGIFGPPIALFDQPMRWLLRGSCGTGQTFVVPENAQARDSHIVNSLWEASSHMCGLPPDFRADI